MHACMRKSCASVSVFRQLISPGANDCLHLFDHVVERPRVGQVRVAITILGIALHTVRSLDCDKVPQLLKLYLDLAALALQVPNMLMQSLYLKSLFSIEKAKTAKFGQR